MKELLEYYKRRLKDVMELISEGGSLLRITSLGTEARCYRTFIAELETIINNQ
jgi:hypothetical protein